MNERIKQLIDLAGGVSHDDDGQELTPMLLGSGLEHFAELIIKECAEVAQDFVMVENNKLVETFHISPWHLQDKIKEHFGVDT